MTARVSRGRLLLAAPIRSGARGRSRPLRGRGKGCRLAATRPRLRGALCFPGAPPLRPRQGVLRPPGPPAPGVGGPVLASARGLGPCQVPLVGPAGARGWASGRSGRGLAGPCASVGLRPATAMPEPA